MEDIQNLDYFPFPLAMRLFSDIPGELMPGKTAGLRDTVLLLKPSLHAASAEKRFSLRTGEK